MENKRIFQMNNIFKVIVAFSIYILGAVSPIHAQESQAEYEWYGQPIKYNSSYVADVESLILESMADRGWRVKEKAEREIVAWLPDEDNNEIIIKIMHNASEISFEAISERKLHCRSGRRCQVSRSDLGKWRHFLRQSMTTNIHRAAVADLLKNAKLRKQFLRNLQSKDIRERTKLAREIIVEELYAPEILSELVAEIQKGFDAPELSKQAVQMYAYYCKALALSKDKAYLPLLNKVIAKTNDDKLRDYVEGYLSYYKS